MRITLLPSSIAGTPEHQHLTTFLVDDSIAVDAGSLGLYGSPSAQARVRHVILTHSHLDHLATLPAFLENVYGLHPEGVTVHATEPVLACLRSDLFNDRVWPDLLRLAPPGAPFLTLRPMEPERAIELGGLRFTPVPVDHPVPTVGLIIEQPGAAVVIATDTGPTARLWELANERPDLKAVFLDLAFPDAMQGLADLSGHLTPTGFAAEARKIAGDPRLLAIHLKPRHAATIEAELNALRLPRVEVCHPGREYHF